MVHFGTGWALALPAFEFRFHLEKEGHGIVRFAQLSNFVGGQIDAAQHGRRPGLAGFFTVLICWSAHGSTPLMFVQSSIIPVYPRGNPAKRGPRSTSSIIEVFCNITLVRARCSKIPAARTMTRNYVASSNNSTFSVTMLAFMYILPFWKYSPLA